MVNCHKLIDIAAFVVPPLLDRKKKKRKRKDLHVALAIFLTVLALPVE